MLGATPQCIPSWIHPILAERARAQAAGVLGKKIAKSGCAVNDDGIVPCTPESLRANFESRVKSLGLYPRGRTLSLDAYSIARNIYSEAGSEPIPHKVAMAQAAINRAREDNISISKLVMRGGTNYAKQKGTNPRVASSQDPTWEELVIAELALSGAFEGYIKGAVLYFAPKYYSATRKREIYDTWTDGWGNSRYGYGWIGPTPGIDHNSQFLMRRIPRGDPHLKDAYDQGLAALAQTSRPAIADAPYCSTVEQYASSKWGAAGTALLTMFLGGSLTFLLATFAASPYAAEAASYRRPRPKS